MVAHALTQALCSQRQVDLRESKTILVYRGSSRKFRAVIQRNPDSKKKKKEKKPSLKKQTKKNIKGLVVVTTSSCIYKQIMPGVNSTFLLPKHLGTWGRKMVRSRPARVTQ